ncbi:MAG: PAC2 family protein [Thermodesulfobacteriota bacterium]
MRNIKKEAKKGEKLPVRIYRSLKLQKPSLIVSWQSHDIGKVSGGVVDFLIETLGAQVVGEIDPLRFFSFGGVRFKEDLVHVQESKFLVLKQFDLLIFKSDEPEFEHFRFLNSLLEAAQHYFNIQELYTLSGTISLIPHTSPRRILTVFNQKDMKKRLEGYGLEPMTWKGPPAISSFLLWIAKKKGILGVSLWPEIPFYLASGEDPEAMRVVLSFLNHRFNLSLELEKFEKKIRKQEEEILNLRKENHEIDDYISRLEKGLPLDEEEQVKLAKEVYEYLRGRG